MAVKTVTEIDGYKIKDASGLCTTCQGTITTLTSGPGVFCTCDGGLGVDDWIQLETKGTTSLATGSRGSTTSREYAVGLDKNGVLSVNVPWTDTKLGAGTNISTSSNTVSVANVGTTYSGNLASAKSISSGTNTTVCATSAALPVGVYIVTGTIDWNADGGHGTGVRRLKITNSSSTNLNDFCQTQIPAYNTNTNEPIIQQVNAIINLTTSQKLYITAYHNAGTTVKVTDTRITAIRVK